MSGETFFGGSGHFRGVAAATQLTKDAQRFEVKFVWLPKRNPLHNQKRRISENLDQAGSSRSAPAPSTEFDHPAWPTSII